MDKMAEVVDNLVSLRGCCRLACVLAAAICTGHGMAMAMGVGQLRCEYRNSPLGLDTPQPRLSWVLEPDYAGAWRQHQTACQILVATTAKQLDAGQGDLWDTGRLLSDQSIQVEYAGRRLSSGMECYWKVRVWDQDGKASPWSHPAHWTMGLLQPADWHAQWIGLDAQDGPMPAKSGDQEDRRLAARNLRREFSVRKKLRRATAYVSGLGLFEFYLNGQKVGDNVLSPALTDYSKRTFYVTFDVTHKLRPGANAAGVILGNGRFYAPRVSVPTKTVSYGFPKLLFQMRLEYADGTSAEIVSDRSWKLSVGGPIRANSEYDGEEYDARQELGNWSKPHFEDGEWQPARLVEPPDGALAAQMIEPVRVTQTLKPLAMAEPQPGVYVFDFGQNLAGWCRLQVAGPSGATVSLRHAETLRSDGRPDYRNMGSARATDKYILKGQGREIYEPRFTIHGFRYVEMTGFSGTPNLSALQARVVHDDLESTGDFSCSNPLLNRIYQNVRWGLRGNYRSIPTDCPQRDERQGWLGDRLEESRGESYVFNTAALYRKWLQDMADAQKDNGSVSDVCPSYWPLYNDDVTWPSTMVVTPGILYEQYGDLDIIRRNYASAARWMAHMSGFVTNGLISRDRYDDWCMPPEAPKVYHSKDPARKTAGALIATAYFYHDAQLMARYATLLKKPEDARRFSELAEKLKAAFNQKFFDPQTGRYDNGTQTASVPPLAFGLVPEPDRERVFGHLVQKIMEANRHVGTGLIGCQWLMRVLSDNGRADLAYTLAAQDTCPSWGYMVEKGATTVWELWNGDTVQPPMSYNHVMLVGDFVIWLYEYLAGIKSDPERPGFEHIIMRPEPVGDLRWVMASHRSPYGVIISEWKLEAARFHWNITIPPNTTATIWVPATRLDSITVNGQTAVRAREVQLLSLEGGRALFAAKSGTYCFESRW